MSFGISKELLGEVLGEDFEILLIDEHFVRIRHREAHKSVEWCNHKVADMCKEWAFKNGYELFSRILSNDHQMRGNCLIIRVESDSETVLKIENADTEPEAIFLACEYILNSIKQ